MLTEILNNLPMNEDYETDWFPLISESLYKNSKKATAESLQISWYNVTGTLNGTIELISSNDMENSVSGLSVRIDSSSNQSNAVLIVLLSVFRYFKLKYTKNGITNGSLSAVVAYSE
ncbi:MAG: hypothetical protein ABSG15_00490 [FCB group bacterium]|jgi:hypothetical protein